MTDDYARLVIVLGGAAFAGLLVGIACLHDRLKRSYSQRSHPNVRLEVRRPASVVPTLLAAQAANDGDLEFPYPSLLRRQAG